MLCMNGRALNEKAIEVSPSSARVLDRAADMLMPFPPSKNRPRPGDWNCPSCGFSNFQRRTACFRCSYPAMGGQPHGPDPNMGYGGGGYGYGHNMMGGHHMNHNHHMGHGHGRGPPQSSVPFRAGDWKCGSDGCGYHNFAKNVSCLRCGASRATAAIVAEPGYPGGPMDNHSSYGMHGGMGGNGGHGSYGGRPGGYGQGPSYQNQQYGPQSTFALPSGMGAGASPYPPMGSHYTQSSAPHSGFDSRAESAFASTSQTPTTANGGNNYGFEGASDPFSFLSSGLGSLSVNDTENRRNGAATKSPS
jgi:hypothetical protein